MKTKDILITFMEWQMETKPPNYNFAHNSVANNFLEAHPEFLSATEKEEIENSKRFDIYKPLADRIYKFIDDYAAVSPNWDGYDRTEKYTSPDTYEMLASFNQLLIGNIPKNPCGSEWSGGCYKPYSSQVGKEEHDYLVKEINKLVNS